MSEEQSGESVATRIAELAVKINRKADRSKAGMGLTDDDIVKAMVLALRARAVTSGQYVRDWMRQ